MTDNEIHTYEVTVEQAYWPWYGLGLFWRTKTTTLTKTTTHAEAMRNIEELWEHANEHCVISMRQLD